MFCVNVCYGKGRSPLHTVRHCSQTITKPLFLKKMSFVKRDEKRSTQYLSWAAVFANVCSNWKYPWIRRKKFVVFVKRLPTPQTHFTKKRFTKCSRIMTNHSLHTIRVSHEFHPFVLFHHCSHLVRSRLFTKRSQIMANHSLRYSHIAQISSICPFL